MAALLELMLRIGLSSGLAVAISAVGWAVAHSWFVPTWGLVIWWPFLIFSSLYVTWRERGWALGLAVPAAVHALNNSLPALLLASRNA